MLVVGLTGIMASGKTETAKIFARFGAGVFDADACVHDFYRSATAISAIGDIFPRAVEKGYINRQILSSILSSDSTSLTRLEEIVHPHIDLCRHAFIAEMEQLGRDVVILDIPLLFETGGEKYTDKIVVVTAKKDIIRDRIFSRNGGDNKVFSTLLSRQMSDLEKRSRADYVIDTGKGYDCVIAQVRSLMEEFRLLGQEKRDKKT